MDVMLSLGEPDDEQAVRNLFVAYLHELAAWDTGIAMNEVGLPVWTGFAGPGPRTLDECATFNWWIRGRCLRYAIRADGAAIGFAIVCERPEHIEEVVDFEVLDFYVAPKARRQKVGERAARSLLERHHGSGLLFTLPENRRAQAFWRAVLARSARDVVESKDATEFRFQSGVT